MARDTNFTKAVKELLGNEPTDNAVGENQAEQAGSGEAISGHAAEFVSTPQPPEASPYSRESAGHGIAVSSENATYISKDTVITGSLESRSNVLMEGQMNGDITTQKDIRITGKVDGNVGGDNIVLNDGAVIGDMDGQSDVLVDSTAVVIGNVNSANIDSDGRIKGSLKIGNAISLKSNAIVFGNITSRTLNVQDGAVLRGNVQVISSRANEEDLFAIRKSPQLGELEG